MIDLGKRSYTKELMDRDDIPFADMAITLKELDFINTYLGGHAITLKGVRQFINTKPDLVICEIGCGGGDNLSAIDKYCSRNRIKASFIGIDMNPECISFARQQYPTLPCEWICSDYALASFNKKPDIIFSSLFCHHFTDEQLSSMMLWLKENSRMGFFINDLHRHWLAFYLIRYLTSFFSRSYLVKNDASLSVARSFKKADWKTILQQSGFKQFSISWQWAFRFLVTVKHEQQPI
jgi:2-polyprenyl-3-methyl-5-hydroxy-6-metoxy-1,4-benzoquinol methylase